MPKCRLCLEEKSKLQKKSHIIPSFMFKPLKRDKSFVEFTTKHIDEGKEPRTRFDGPHQGDLLCHDCETKLLSGFESYSSNLLYGGAITPERLLPKAESRSEHLRLPHLVFSNIDYRKFKLFLLSVLWRSSISTLPMFNEVHLGPHEERIRKIIFEGNPKDEDCYPIAISTYTHRVPSESYIVAPPLRLKMKDGYTVYLFLIGATFYMYFVLTKSRGSLEEIMKYTVNANGVLNVALTESEKELNAILRRYGLTVPASKFLGFK